MIINGTGLSWNCSYDERIIAIKQEIEPISDSILYFIFC
jgi:hypothetical protein